MSVSSDGRSGAAPAATTAGAGNGSGSEAETEGESAQTGLFGRVVSYFSGNSGEASGGADAGEGTPRPMTGLPSLGNLRRMRVEDVAVPRVEITAVPIEIDREGLYAVFKESGNTRLPVYDGTLDAPLGLIHLKDFALTYGFNGDADAAFDLRSLVRPLLYAPPSMPLGVLLQKMQTDRCHMALVIDEYGGVDGLLTIEDLLEQVVGEIEDEHDEVEDALWTEEKPGCFLALARTPVDEFERMAGVSLDTEGAGEEIDTLGGLVFMMIGRVPTRGEVIPHPSGVQFEVVDADPRRIKRLRVRMPGVKRTPTPTVPPSVAPSVLPAGGASSGAASVGAVPAGTAPAGAASAGSGAPEGGQAG